jgi:hypothetical protein
LGHLFFSGQRVVKFFELSFRYHEDELACMFFKVIALSPFVFSSLKEALFKVTDCI